MLGGNPVYKEKGRHSTAPFYETGYFVFALNPPALQDRQMPNVEPLPTMFVHRLLTLANSAGLKVAFKNGVSVTANPPDTLACTVVPKASNPEANGKAAVPASGALLVQVVPVAVGPASVFNSLTTMELGLTPVSVLLTKSLFADRDTNPFGVIRQEQQETSCSSGENA